MESDLVLIGPNVPHLNFDYGIETEYRQIVVQLKENFLGDAFKETPEFSRIYGLLQRAYLGLSFRGESKTIVAERLKTMNGEGHSEQLLNLLEVFQILATSDEIKELNEQIPALNYSWMTKYEWVLSTNISMLIMIINLM